MATNTVKTTNFDLFDQYRTLNQPFTLNGNQYSTLNEFSLFSGLGNVNPPSPIAGVNVYPTLQYMAIGNGGNSSVIGAGNSTLIDILQHAATDSVLFNHIPFVLVPLTSDLSAIERAGYRLRIVQTVGGIQYVGYYLKLLNLSGITPSTQIVTLTNGAITSNLPYTPASSRLAPTPVNISNTNVNISTGSHLITQSIIPVTLNATDIAGIINACTILYGDIRFATISEVGLVAGFDIPNFISPYDGISYTEIQTAQIMSFIGCIEALQQNPTSVPFQFGLSNSSPYPA